jgi:hypothetical protein
LPRGVSLHGLKSDTTYAVVAARAGCSASGDGGQVYTKQFRTPIGGDDVFRSATVDRNGSLTNAKSVRVYEIGR